MTSRREEEPGSCWRGAAGGCFCETETGAAAAALDDAADAEASREKTMRFGLRGGDLAAPILVAAAGSRAALLLNGSCCFLVGLMDVGERLLKKGLNCFFFFFA